MTGTGGLQRVPVGFVSNYQLPLPPMKIQKQIITELYGYRKIIEANKELNEVYEKKIRDKISEFWGT